MSSPSFGSLIPSKEKIKKRRVIGEMEGRELARNKPKAFFIVSV